MPKKRPREVPAVDTQLVEIYEDLANDNEEIRIKATHALLNKSASESGLTAEQVKEVLRRLIRGLCSGRKGARLGFSIALTELLSQLFRANATHVLPMSHAEFIQLLKKETEITGNVSGQVCAVPLNIVVRSVIHMLQRKKEITISAVSLAQRL